MDMDLVIIFSFVTGIVLIITGGILLAPIARKLGIYLEAAAEERRTEALGPGAPRALPDAEAHRLAEALERIEQHVMALDERQQFTERMLEGRTGEPSQGG